MFKQHQQKIKGLKNVVLAVSLGYIFWSLLKLVEDEKPLNQAKKKIENWKKNFDAGDIKKEIEQTFEKTSQGAVDQYRQIKQELITRISSTVKSLEEIDEDKYSRLVEEIIAEFEDEGELSKAQLKKLKKNLIQDYQKLK